MTVWTVRNAEGKFSNAWTSPSGIVLRSHLWQRVFRTKCTTIEDALQTHVGTAFHPHQFEESIFAPGEYHPRMHREIPASSFLEVPEPTLVSPREMASSLQSARNLFAQLRGVFRYVQPANANRGTFGDQIRSLLILACTEVESAGRSVLLANHGATAEDRLKTCDYIKLKGPMRLDAWSVKLPGYPDYPAVASFRSWNQESPTQSLSWYDAYNRVKHDRESNLPIATLECMLAAMSALYIMLAAQFGVRPLHANDPVSVDLVVETAPDWPLAELYVPCLDEDGSSQWRQKPYF